jgi:hypothetical protein
MRIGIGPVDELDPQAARSLQEERAGVVALLLGGDLDARALQPVAESGPFLDPDRDVVDALGTLAFFGVP